MVPFGDLPHFLQVEFFDAGFVGRDSGALDADAVLLDGVGRVDRHLIGGLVAVLDAEVVVFERDVEIGVDQLVLDELPDDAGHLIAVEFDDGASDFDLLHVGQACRLNVVDAAHHSCASPPRQVPTKDACSGPPCGIFFRAGAAWPQFGGQVGVAAGFRYRRQHEHDQKLKSVRVSRASKAWLSAPSCMPATLAQSTRAWSNSRSRGLRARRWNRCCNTARKCAAPPIT